MQGKERLHVACVDFETQEHGDVGEIILPLVFVDAWVGNRPKHLHWESQNKIGQ